VTAVRVPLGSKEDTKYRRRRCGVAAAARRGERDRRGTKKRSAADESLQHSDNWSECNRVGERPNLVITWSDNVTSNLRNAAPQRDARKQF